MSLKIIFKNKIFNHKMSLKIIFKNQFLNHKMSLKIILETIFRLKIIDNRIHSEKTEDAKFEFMLKCSKKKNKNFELSDFFRLTKKRNFQRGFVIISNPF